MLDGMTALQVRRAALLIGQERGFKTKLRPNLEPDMALLEPFAARSNQ